GARDRDHSGWLAALPEQCLPALAQSALRAPADLDHARVLAGLAAGEVLPDGGLVAVVGGGFKRQPAGVRGSGVGDRALPACGVGGVLGGNDPEKTRRAAWVEIAASHPPRRT